MKAKNYIGIMLIIFCIAYFYTFPYVASKVVDESSILIGCLFFFPYMFLITLTSLYLYRKELFMENLILNAFTLVFSNSYAIGIMYFFAHSLLRETKAWDIVEKVYYALLNPYGILDTRVFIILVILLPLIPLVSLILSVVKPYSRISSELKK